MQLTKPQEQSLKSFGKYVQEGIAAWTKAGEIIVSLIDENKMTLEQISESLGSEWATLSTLSSFERIGRKQILPDLLIADYPAAKYVMRLPMSDQQRLIEKDETVSLLVLKQNGPDELKANIRNLSPAQCRQVFEKTSIRPLAKQRLFIEEQKQKKTFSNAKPETPFVIMKGRVQFNSGCELSRKELIHIMAQMEN